MDAARSLLQALSAQHGARLDVRKFTEPVVDARAANIACGKRGTVRCGKVWRGQRSDQIPYRDDSLPIFASKGKGQIGNALSPFNVEAPVGMLRWATATGETGGPPLPLPQKLELVWQAAKKAVDESWEAYFTRRARIYNGRTPKRRYIDRGVGIDGACFGTADDALVQYVPSRVFYCTAYGKAIEKAPEFRIFQALVNEGFNVIILGPDGNPIDIGDGDVEAAYMDPAFPFGHERVLVAMLRQEMPWKSRPRCWRE